jgi:hypothetical protein
MAAENRSEQDRRKFPRFDVPEGVTALDGEGRVIGRVLKVSGGGMQIRVSPESAHRTFATGSQLEICVLEGEEKEDRFHVEVRNQVGDILGVRFLGKPSQTA